MRYVQHRSRLRLRLVALLLPISLGACRVPPCEYDGQDQCYTVSVETHYQSVPGGFNLVEATDGGACAATASDDACLVCAETSCCTEVLACNQDAACACVINCRIATGDTADECAASSACDAAADATYDAAQACVADRCATQCPGLL